MTIVYEDPNRADCNNFFNLSLCWGLQIADFDSNIPISIPTPIDSGWKLRPNFNPSRDGNSRMKIESQYFSEEISSSDCCIISFHFTAVVSVSTKMKDSRRAKRSPLVLNQPRRNLPRLSNGIDYSQVP